MTNENVLKIEKYNEEIERINDNFSKKEDAIADVVKGSLVTYSVGIIGIPISLATNHPYLAMVCTGASLLSITAFSLSLGVVSSADKKIRKLNNKIKVLERNNSKEE